METRTGLKKKAGKRKTEGLKSMDHKPLTSGQIEMVVHSLLDIAFTEKDVEYDDDAQITKEYTDFVQKRIKMLINRCDKLADGEKLRNHKKISKIIGSVYG